jgi:hypothetical protein
MADTYEIFMDKNETGLRSACKIAIWLEADVIANSRSEGALMYATSRSVSTENIVNLDAQKLLISAGIVSVAEIKNIKALIRELNMLYIPEIFFLIDGPLEANTGEKKIERDRFDRTIFYFNNGEFYCQRLSGAGAILGN